MATIKYEIIKEIGVISESENGWSKQINLISWNGGEPKYDIRSWAPNRESMSKGLTLTAAELQALTDLLNDIEL